MASNTNSAAGSNADQDIDWSTVEVLVNCDQCGGQFDAIADAHESLLCGVCQILFGGNKPANVPTAANTTLVAVAPALREGHILCRTCGRSFRPTDKNNGADCTKCCNRAANEGVNIFARYGKKMAPQAEGLLQGYHQRQSMPAIAPIAAFRGATFSTAPTFSAQPTTGAPGPRKRAAESDNEQTTQQNEPNAKRSKTSQQQATTMQNTRTAQAAADTLAIAEQDRLMAESLNLPPSDNGEPTQPSERTAEHPETVPTNPEQTTQSGGDDGDLAAFLRAHMSD